MRTLLLIGILLILAGYGVVLYDVYEDDTVDVTIGGEDLLKVEQEGLSSEQAAWIGTGLGGAGVALVLVGGLAPRRRG